MREYMTLLLGLLVAAGAPGAGAQQYSAREPYIQPVIAGRDLEVGSIHAWETEGHLHLRYESGEYWRLTETRVRVTGPGWDIMHESLHRCIRDTTYDIDLTWTAAEAVAVRAEAGVTRASASDLCASYYFPKRQPRAEFTWPPERGAENPGERNGTD
jgi:hypothetical protein